MTHSLILHAVNHMRPMTASYLKKTGNFILPSLDGEGKSQSTFSPPHPISVPGNFKTLLWPEKCLGTLSVSLFARLWQLPLNCAQGS